MLQTLERVILDPISEVPPYQVLTNRPLEVTGLRAPSPEGHGIFLVEHSYPRPESTATFASSRDSQGEAKFGKPKLANRKIPIKVFLSEAQGVGAMTNLSTNPAGEVVAKFTNPGDYPVKRELGTRSIPALAGEFRDSHSYDGSSSSLAVASIPFTFPAAGTYAVSCFIWIPSSWDGGKFSLGTGATYAGSSGEVTIESDLSKRDQWQRLQMKVTVAAGDLVGTLSIHVAAQPSTPATGVFYSDALQIESGAAASPWCYGDTPGCEWNGTPNASTTMRFGSGSDRKRFIRSLFELQEKVEKLSEEQGTMKRVLPDGSWMVFDVLDASFVGNWEKRFNQGQEEFAFELTCKPGARLEPITLTTHEETTLPVLKFTEAVIPGNMPALGDLLIEDLQGVDRKFCAVAAASRFLDPSANGDVFYEAENRLRLGSASLAAGSGIPSGSEANKVVNVSLFTSYAPVLSTRSSTGVYTTHAGAQHLFARVWRPEANTGEVTLRFEYAQGDLLRWRPITPVSFAANSLEGQWLIVDLGVVRLNLAALGTQRWEGRLTGKSTVLGDTMQVDWLAILPAEEFYGEARAVTVPPGSVGAEIAADNYINGTGGSLTGLTATLGGAWTGAGSAADFTVPTVSGEPLGLVVRILFGGKPSTHFDVSGEFNDPPVAGAPIATGRWDRLGTGTQADVSVSCEYESIGIVGIRAGVFARYVDMKNLLMARISQALPGTGNIFAPEYFLEIWKKKEGAWQWLASGYLPKLLNVMVKLTLHASADGSGYATVYSGSTLISTASWSPDADLATGGKLATGGYGIHSTLSQTYTGAEQPYLEAVMQRFAVFSGADTARDAVIYANRKMHVRWDTTLREAEDGSGAFPEVGSWEGDRLLVPQSGRENRPVRVAVLTSREIPEVGPDVQADDTRATLTVTPRTIEVPQSS